MIKLRVQNETSQLRSVVLGIADDLGGTPKPQDAYDPQSLVNITKGTYPEEKVLVEQMENFRRLLEKYDVTVLRPVVLPKVHQVYARDIGFVIEDYFVVANVIEDRKEEFDGIIHILNQVDPDKILRPPQEVRIEGGDVMPWNDKIYVGYSGDDDFAKYKVSRTNRAGVEWLASTFDCEIVASELEKSDTVPSANALHLDCCFQPIGKDQAIICRAGFKQQSEFERLFNAFNCLEISAEEMSVMGSNVFSISPEVIVSDSSFRRINAAMRQMGFTVEEIAYQEVAKMGGLFRCSTLPLERI